MSERLILMGRILGAHGVKGLVKLASFADNPEDIASYGPLFDKYGEQSWKVKLNGVMKNHFLATLSGVTTKEQVDALKGTELFVPRNKLPKPAKGEYYYTDLIGLEARLSDGTVYGKVRDMKNYGAGDIMFITRPKAHDELIIFSPTTVPAVHVEEGYLTLNPPEYTEARPEEGEDESAE